MGIGWCCCGGPRDIRCGKGYLLAKRLGYGRSVLFRARWLVVVLLVGLVGLVVQAGPAGGVPRPPSGPTPKTGPPTQVVMSGTGPGQSVQGFVPAADFPFDPVAEGYPPTDPAVGFVGKDEPFAGIIHGTPPGGGPPQLQLYCIDLHTLTQPGIGYVLGTWDAIQRPERGLCGAVVERVLPTHRRARRSD